jgi:hypothetical protein
MGRAMVAFVCLFVMGKNVSGDKRCEKKLNDQELRKGSKSYDSVGEGALI